ncbi:MAG TPA: DinB family protein [Chloroflexota bacterium]|nr:DinB family protein [Chloroflexota bacterium]
MVLSALTLLREQVARADSLTTEVFANVTTEQLVWLPSGGMTNPIGSTFLHLYHAEDRLIHRLLGDKPTLFAANGWQARLGYDPAQPWTPLSNPDPSALRAYAVEVGAATKSYLEGLEPEELEREVATARGQRPLHAALSLNLVIHKFTHLGEIAGLLGCQGIKGFPV